MSYPLSSFLQDFCATAAAAKLEGFSAPSRANGRCAKKEGSQDPDNLGGDEVISPYYNNAPIGFARTSSHERRGRPSLPHESQLPRRNQRQQEGLRVALHHPLGTQKVLTRCCLIWFLHDLTLRPVLCRSVFGEGSLSEASGSDAGGNDKSISGSSTGSWAGINNEEKEGAEVAYACARSTTSSSPLLVPLQQSINANPIDPEDKTPRPQGWAGDCGSAGALPRFGTSCASHPPSVV